MPYEVPYYLVGMAVPKRGDTTKYPNVGGAQKCCVKVFENGAAKNPNWGHQYTDCFPDGMSTKSFERQLEFRFVTVHNIVGISADWRMELYWRPPTLSARIYCKEQLVQWNTTEFELKVVVTEVCLHALPSTAGFIRTWVDDGIKHEATFNLLKLDRHPGGASKAIILIKLTEHYPDFKLALNRSDDNNNFETPSHLTDVALIVEDKRIHTNKAFLAMHSRFFDTMFFGCFAEKNKDEIELKQHSYAKFVEFLRVLDPQSENCVCSENLEDVLELAAYYVCPALLRECARFLLAERGMTLFEKLRLADKYCLRDVEEAIIKSLSYPAALSARNAFERDGTLSERAMSRLCAQLAIDIQ